MSHQPSLFYEHQPQRSSSGSTGPFGPQHAGWGGRETHLGLSRRKTVEGAPQGAHTLSPPYNSRYPKIARKAAACSAEKTQQPAASYRPLQQQQQQPKLQGYGWHDKVPQCPQDQQQEQVLLLPLQRTQHLGAAGWPESSSDSSLSGIERSVLKLVEESPGNLWNVCTPQGTSNDQEQQHRVKQQLVQYSSVKDICAAVCDASAVAAAFKGPRVGKQEEEFSDEPQSVAASTAPQTPRNACDRATEGEKPPMSKPSPNGLSDAPGCLFQWPHRVPATEQLHAASVCWCRHACLDQQAGEARTSNNVLTKTQREHKHQCRQPQQHEQQPSHSGLQFLWQHPASVLATTIQNTAATDLAFLPLCCDGAANGI